MPANVNSAKKPEKEKKKKVIKLEPQKEGAPVISPEYDPEDLIFALDIGTRTVVGVVGVQEKDKFKVIAAESFEHKNRAMLDGQIHDISQVAEISKEVKEKLEQKIGVTLTKVAIAAAGRVLKTCEIKVERDIEQGREIDKELVGSLEMEGVQQAQKKLDEEVWKNEKIQFYCVGYSVINYYLNGYVISSLIGHRGTKIGADILATFLPHIVVDSLYTVMNKIGLEVISLTLEPIAAINVTIPKDLRLLNLALVDIGAGTSDIAITRDGSVVAYAMAPVAGDEITERIAQHYLVDFNTGERIKVSLSSAKDAVSFVDILGKKHAVKVPDILEVIKPSIECLSETISQKILEYNHKAPNAVFLIGGGSQIPGLTEMVATRLKLPRERVVVRGRDVIQNIKFSGKKLSGPEAITPFGIAVTAQMQRGQDFLSVTINDKKVRLFNSKQLTIADALILVGFNPGQLIGKTGKAVTFELDGSKKVVRGEYGKAAEISVNGTPANLGTVLKVGDSIRVNPAEDGRDAEVKVSDFVSDTKAESILFNGGKMDIGTRVYINGGVAAADSRICDGDTVHTSRLLSVNDLIMHAEIDSVTFGIIVNGQEAGPDYILRDSDVVECRRKEPEPQVEEPQEQNPDSVLVDDSGAVIEDVAEKAESVYAPGETGAEGNAVRVMVNGKPILIRSGKEQYIFVDVFNYIDFDLSRPQGNIALSLNGKQAGFTDVIKSGDIIEIYWEK